jgi:hypothetical protein
MKSIAFVFTLLCTTILFAQPKPTTGADRLKNEFIRKQLQKNSLVNHIPFRNIGQL